MGLASMIAGAAATVAKTASNANKNKSTSSSGSSSSSSGSGSSGSGYRPVGTNTDESIRQSNPSDYAGIQQAKNDYAAAQARGDTQKMQEANNDANAIRAQYGYTGGKDGSETNYLLSGNGSGASSGGMYGKAQNTMNSAYDDYQAAMNAAAEEQRRAQEAAVQQSVNALSSQKDAVREAGGQGNTAAEQAYMSLIDPNSANAEALAARGLSTSGLSESSLIGAGNTYQNALNNNQRSVNEQLGKIDQAITNARLTGDIATAEALASYRQAVANAGLEQANRIAALQQQGVQDANANALSAGQALGYINGQQTLAGKQADSQIAAQTIENQMAQENLRILLALGYSNAEADLQARRLSNAGISLSNQLTQTQITGQNLQNRYMQRQF